MYRKMSNFMKTTTNRKQGERKKVKYEGAVVNKVSRDEEGVH